MEFISFLFQDWEANKKNSKGRFVLTTYRLAAWLTTKNGILHWIGLPYCIFYRIVFGWLLGIELPLRSKVGPGLRLFHGQGLVVHESVEIGARVVLRHCTTIGAKSDNGLVPKIGNDVDIGANSVVIGSVELGDGCIVGAGCVVTKSVPAGVVVVGNPARILVRTEFVRKPVN